MRAKRVHGAVDAPPLRTDTMFLQPLQQRRRAKPVLRIGFPAQNIKHEKRF